VFSRTLEGSDWNNTRVVNEGPEVGLHAWFAHEQPHIRKNRWSPTAVRKILATTRNGRLLANGLMPATISG
jgi:hypothetical protein